MLSPFDPGQGQKGDVMLQWMIMPFRRYADFNGRARRMEFWSFVLLNVIVYTAIIGIMFTTGFSMTGLAGAETADPAILYGLFGGTGFLIVAWWLFALLPSIAVTVRRLHDRDMSGWWYLGFFVASFLPLIGLIVGIAMMVLMLMPGTPGPNSFGPDPKDPAGAEVFA